LTPSLTPLFATLSVDLNARLREQSGSNFLVQASGPSGGASATANYEVTATTNIPGLSTLFDLTIHADSNNPNTVSVGFNSTQIMQPLFGSDFTNDPSTPGLHILPASKGAFDVPFEIPRGVISTINGEGVGLALDFLTTARASIPEPSSAILGLTGALGVLVAASRRRRAAA
jgi:hypothetical protein